MVAGKFSWFEVAASVCYDVGRGPHSVYDAVGAGTVVCGRSVCWVMSIED